MTKIKVCDGWDVTVELEDTSLVTLHFIEEPTDELIKQHWLALLEAQHIPTTNDESTLDEEMELEDGN